MNRLYFRELALSDAQALFEIYSDKEAMQYRNTPPFEKYEESVLYIENVLAKNNPQVVYRWGVVHIDSDEVMGTAFYKFIENSYTVEVGVSIGRKFWNGGYGREILQKLVDTIKVQLPEVELIVGIINNQNIASLKMTPKVGFKFIRDMGTKSRYEYQID